MKKNTADERLLVASPILAASIGLEEAVLWQALLDGSQHQSNDAHIINMATLIKWLPLWNEYQIRGMLTKLDDRGMIQFDTPLIEQDGHILFRIMDVAKTSWQQDIDQQVNTHPPAHTKDLKHPSWQPSRDTLRYLVETLDIPRSYSEVQITKFIDHQESQAIPEDKWNVSFIRWVNRSYKQDQSNRTSYQGTANHKKTMDHNWQPKGDALKILLKADIDNQFIDSCRDEFIVFWMHKAEAHENWDTKFIAWVRRQWATQIHASSTPTPTPIQTPMVKGWQPAEDVFEILAMSNINREFAEKLVPEFVLYWQEANQLHTSWNSKFLGHVKHKWLKRTKSIR